MSGSLQPHGLYSPWNSPGQNTRAGSFSLLQGIFPTQGSKPGLAGGFSLPAESQEKLVLEVIGKVFKKNKLFGIRKDFIVREPKILFLEY